MDVLIVSLGSTEGLRRADEELRGSLERAGARVRMVSALVPRRRRTLMLTDLGWALAARAAASGALADTRASPAPAIVYSSTTAALLWPRPGAIRFDAPSAGNRAGRHGLWQRPLERRRLEQAPLLLPWSEGALREAPLAATRSARAIVLPVPVESSAPVAPVDASGAEQSASFTPVRDIAAITYAANPAKKGLDHVLAAWRAVRTARAPEPAVDPADELVIAGATVQDLERAGIDPSAEEGTRVVGALPAGEYRALLRRSRVFVCAPRREDYGIAQLEALADGCLLVTTPAPGPYTALPIARALDQRLVSEDLSAALRTALLDPPAGYALRAREALAAFRFEVVDGLVADAVLPSLDASRHS